MTPAECRGVCPLKLPVYLPESWLSLAEAGGETDRSEGPSQVFNVGQRRASVVPGAGWLSVSVCLVLDWGSGASQPLSLTLVGLSCCV